MKMKKILGLALAAALALSLTACGGGDKPSDASKSNTPAGGSTSQQPSTPDPAPSGELITVGIINNDPNESGYRTANDAAMRATFTEDNGYKATFYNNNDAAQQIATAQQMVQDEVDFLLLSPASTTGWDTVLKDAQAAGITHGVDGDVIVMGFDCNKWALEELLAGRWNYDGQCNPFQAETVDGIIKDLMAGKAPAQKVIYTPEQGFDAKTITAEDMNNFGI